MIVFEKTPQTRAENFATRKSHHALVRRAKKAGGYLWHTRYRRPRQSNPPRGSRGVIAYFSSDTQLQNFVQALPSRLTDPAGSSRILLAEPSGYSNGIWRAEEKTMQHIERFTPVSAEVDREKVPPLVSATGQLRSDTHLRRSRTDRSRSHTASPEHSAAFRPITETRAMFIGATRYRGIKALIILSRTWYPMVTKMTAMSGYIWHTVYWEAPFVLGTLAFFDSRDALLTFARSPQHRHLMQWITDGTTNGTAGYIRLYAAIENTAGDSR